jgi:peptidoglycan/xylan/chitin deacetylase (PgdA/CDA1 family)
VALTFRAASSFTHGEIRFREVARDRLEHLLAAGFRNRHVFPHRLYHLPKSGPDGFDLAKRMRGRCTLEQLWELVLFADAELAGSFPPELFFDPDVAWHQQHFGRAGQVAAAAVVLDGESLYSMAHHSDLVQRIGRRRAYKTEVEKRFGGWHHMLLNGVLAFGVEHGVRRVHVPTADLAREHTDRARKVDRPLFDRVYDRAVTERFPARRIDGWWEIDVGAARERIVMPDLRVETAARERTICLCHDVEAGLGHRETDPSLARAADDGFRAALTEMLAAEGEAGVRATYGVVGALLDDVRPEIENGGHCIAFHTYDHALGGQRAGRIAVSSHDLERCRRVDYRVKGYRPAPSRITRAADEKLVEHNFEWVASPSVSRATVLPVMRRRLARIPLAVDDVDLYKGRTDYARWEREALRRVEASGFAALRLHDCYAWHWLPHYRRFLDQLLERGRLQTVDEVAADLILASAA